MTAAPQYVGRHRPTTAPPTREDLAAALAETASLLYTLWRCNTDRERAALGAAVAPIVNRYAVNPSWILLGRRP